MARYTGPVCRQCRREGLKLYLKGERCLSKKCSIDRRSYPPGHGGQRRFAKMKEYGIQLREKQKVKRFYSVMEKQFRGYFRAADRAKGVTGENLLLLLEVRLDNVVHKMGFTSSGAQARQLIRHNHFSVNGGKMNIPSYKTRPGDVVAVREKSRKSPFIIASLESKSDDQIPEWLTVDREAMSGSVTQAPMRDSIQTPINEQLIVELYSK